jgi:hypothetical protein
VIYFAVSHFVKLGTECHCDLDTTFTDLFPHHENPTPLYNRSMTRMSFIYTLQKKKRIAHFTPFFFYFSKIAVSINVHDLRV